LGHIAINVHFEDRLEDGKMTFDYQLRPGVVRRSNALELMRLIGLGEPIAEGNPPWADRG
jgi:DNA mismatch repair ATPase MutS